MNMNHVREIEFGSTLLGTEPKGCVHCRKGAKMVLLATGLCTCGCYYCPLSEKKMGRDVVYANEWCAGEGTDLSRAGSDAGTHIDNGVVQEARSISATGTGITGGDPLLVLPRTLHFIRLLKETFGPEHHIHLYTASIPTGSQLQELREAGLDEIRFHPADLLDLYSPRESLEEGSALDEFLEGYLDGYLTAIRQSRGIGLSTGVEIPVIPDQIELIDWLVRKLEVAGCEFLNLNELEFSPTNASELVKRGFEVRDDISSAVLGSRETAYKIMERAVIEQGQEQSGMTIHFCSSRYKDAGQLRRRLHRRAVNVVKPHELITDDDTLLIGVLEPVLEPVLDLDTFAEELMRGFEIPGDLVYVNRERNRVETAPWILEEIAGEIRVPTFIIEEYPSSDRLEVEREEVGREERGGEEVEREEREREEVGREEREREEVGRKPMRKPDGGEGWG